MKFIKDRNILLDFFPKKIKVAELGVFKGDFSKILLEKLAPEELYLVDVFPSEMCSGDKDGNNMIYENLELFYPLFVSLYKDNKQVKIIKNTSHSFLESLPDSYLDMVYIDADHSYESVKKDLELSLKKVKTNGIIAGHDYLYTRKNDQITRAVNDFCIENNREISFLTNDGCPTFVIYNRPSYSSNKLKGLSTINCISLEESFERRKKLQQQFEQYNITNINFLISKRFEKCNDVITGKLTPTLNDGTKGCCVSHLKNIKQWLENTNDEIGFFCEDDLSLQTVKYWKQTWCEFLLNLPQDWECVQLLTLNTDINSLNLTTRQWNDWGATAYILKRNYAQKIIDTYIKEDKFILELPEPNTNIQPLVENLLFTLGNTYTVPLFVENVDQRSTFNVDINHNEALHQQTHLTSYKKVIKLWQNKKNTKMVDFFTFYEPLGKEMFELRINMFKDIVDEFIVCESNKTQSGQSIPYKLKEIIADLNFKNLNIRIIELDIPDDEYLTITEEDRINCYEGNYINETSLKARARERMQKDALLQVINEYEDDTVFLHSDIDEIIDPKHIHWIANIVRQNQNVLIKIPLVHLEGRADLRVYNKQTNTPKEWTGMFMCTKHHLLKATPTQLRSNANNPFQVSFVTQGNQILKDLGWHFSWMGNTNIRKIKCQNFTHYDDTFSFLITSKYKNEDTQNFQDNIVLKENEIPPSGDKNLILKKYSLEKLPQTIFILPRVKAFLLPTTTATPAWLYEYSTDIENPSYNFNAGMFYFNQGHTAPALSYFLRCAERTDDKLLAYEALIYGYLCYKEQKIRDETAKSLIMHAVCLLPERPEARWLISVFYEQKQHWMYSYYHAERGLKHYKDNFEPLKTFKDFPGKHGLLFQKAISGYWWGKNDECKTILLELYNNCKLNDVYKQSVRDNLKRIGVEVS